jgi:hypothetical protein
MPCPFTGPKMFWAGPNVFVPDQKFIYILWQSQTFCARRKDDLHSVKLVFCAGTKVFEEVLNIVKILGCFKQFGLAQNILGPEKGQGISLKSWHFEASEYIITKFESQGLHIIRIKY